jgi:hypothetical protein
VLSRPEGLDEREVIAALSDGWGLNATIEYSPLGFGSYHWIATGSDGHRRFLTVDDLGRDETTAAQEVRVRTFATLERALDTASALRDAGGIDRVVAPIRTVAGASLHRVAPRYAMAAFPFVNGRSGAFGDQFVGEELDEVLELLVDLHRATSAVASVAPRGELSLPGRVHVTAALEDLDRAWTGGPYSERTRAAIAESADDLMAALATLDELERQVRSAPQTRVVTHGEPHPGNVIRTAEGAVLVDWDTVEMARPERDLWIVVDRLGGIHRGDRAGMLHAYADGTGHRADEAALAFYALRWDLADIAVYLELLRAPHQASEDVAQSWCNLEELLARRRSRR